MFWESKGIVRALGFGFTFIGQYIAPAIPVVAPFSEGIVALGMLIGGVGTVNAATK